MAEQKQWVAASGADGNAASLLLSDDGWVLSGEMSFGTAVSLLQFGDSAWRHVAPAWIDLRQVARVDSAGMVVLLAWLKRAKANGGKMELRSVPAQFASLADFYGIGPAIAAGSASGSQQ